MKSILLVDDNRVFLETFSEHLHSLLKNFSILTAEDGARAIEILESNHVNLIITDLVMPNVDGYSLLAYARKNHPSIPVIIMTASWSEAACELVRIMGSEQCLEKPFDAADMDLIVKASLRISENSELQ
jgi:CheY-like chemotaxis protein